MLTVKEKIYSGAVCEQLVYNVSERIGSCKKAELRPRFKNAAEREKYNLEKSRRNFVRTVNATFGPSAYWCTMTCSAENEIHDFETAKRELNNFVRRMRRSVPDVQIVAVMGRGKSTHRVHFHAIIAGASEETIREKWNLGNVDRIDHLREKTTYNGKTLWHDYTALANYMFDHWTPEQGKKRWTATKNLVKPEREAPTLVKRTYTEAKPPKPPKGYVFVEAKATTYGFLYYKYVKEPESEKRGRKPRIT